MGEKEFCSVIKYRGSRDGWNNIDFHKISDDIGPTIALFKIKENGMCIGGFTSEKWSSNDDNELVKDNTAMLFNLTTNKIFKS